MRVLNSGSSLASCEGIQHQFRIRETYYNILLQISATNRLLYDISDWELANFFFPRTFEAGENSSADKLKRPWAEPLERESSCIISFIGEIQGSGKSNLLRFLEFHFRQALTPIVVSLNAQALRSATSISSEDQISQLLRTIVHQILCQQSAEASALKMELILNLCRIRSKKTLSWNLPLLWTVLHHASSLQYLPAAGLVILFDDLDDWMMDAGPEGMPFFKKFLEVLESLDHGFFVFISARSYEVVGGLLDGLAQRKATGAENDSEDTLTVSCNVSLPTASITHHNPVGTARSHDREVPLHLHIFNVSRTRRSRRVEETDLRFRNLLISGPNKFKSSSDPATQTEPYYYRSYMRTNILTNLYDWYGTKVCSFVNKLRVKRQSLSTTELKETVSGTTITTSTSNLNTSESSVFKNAADGPLLALSLITLGCRPFSNDELIAALGGILFGMSSSDYLQSHWSILSRTIKEELGLFLMPFPFDHALFYCKIFEEFFIDFEKNFPAYFGTTASEQNHRIPFKLANHATLSKFCLESLCQSVSHLIPSQKSESKTPAEVVNLGNGVLPGMREPYTSRFSMAITQNLQTEGLERNKILQLQYNYLEYAANFWFQHYKNADENIEFLDSFVADRFRDQDFVRIWFEHFQNSPGDTAKWEPWRNSINERFFKSRDSAIHGLQVASALGLDRVVGLLLRDDVDDGNARFEGEGRVQVVMKAACSAARNGFEEIVMKLIQDGLKLFKPGSALESVSCDRVSCKCKDLQFRVIKKLVSHPLWQKLLQLLAARNCVKALLALLNKLHALDPESFPTILVQASLLRTAASAGASTSLNLLFGLWKTRLSDIKEFYMSRSSEFNWNRETLLQHAIEGGDEGCIDLVLKNSVFKYSALKAASDLRQTPLMIAAIQRPHSKSIVEKLIAASASDFKATIKETDCDSRSPLDYAARSGNVETLELLLQHLHPDGESFNSRPQASDYYEIGKAKLVLEDAFYAKKPGIVRLLLRAGYIAPEATVVEWQYNMDGSMLSKKSKRTMVRTRTISTLAVRLLV